MLCGGARGARDFRCEYCGGRLVLTGCAERAFLLVFLSAVQGHVFPVLEQVKNQVECSSFFASQKPEVYSVQHPP